MWPRFVFLCNSLSSWIFSLNNGLVAPFCRNWTEKDSVRCAVCEPLLYQMLLPPLSHHCFGFSFSNTNTCALRSEQIREILDKCAWNATQHNSNQLCIYFWTRMRRNYEPHYHCIDIWTTERLHLSINHHTWKRVLLFSVQFFFYFMVLLLLLSMIIIWLLLHSLTTFMFVRCVYVLYLFMCTYSDKTRTVPN